MRGTRENRKRMIRGLLREFTAPTMSTLSRTWAEEGQPSTLTSPMQIGQSMEDVITQFPVSLRKPLMEFLRELAQAIEGDEDSSGDERSRLQRAIPRVTQALHSAGMDLGGAKTEGLSKNSKSRMSETQLRKQIRSVLKEAEEEKKTEDKASPNAVNLLKKLYKELTGEELKSLTPQELDAVKDTLINTIDTANLSAATGARASKYAGAGQFGSLLKKSADVGGKQAATKI